MIENAGWSHKRPRAPRTVAFRVNSVAQLLGAMPVATITILDAEKVCNAPLSLFVEAPKLESSSEPFDVVP